MSALLQSFAQAMRPPDNRPTKEWAAENVQIIGGKGAYFDPDIALWQGCALDWYDDPEVKQICLIEPTGTGKSVMFEVIICHTVAENPRDGQFSHQTDKPAAIWLEKRVLPALQACKATAPILASTHRHKLRKSELILPNKVNLHFGGANMSNLQDHSLPLVCIQECHEVRPGMISQAKARTHDRFDEKVILVSQGSAVGTEFEKEAAQGELFESGFRCPKCKEVTVFLPTSEDACTDFETALQWDRKIADQGEINWRKLFDSLRYIAPCCGAEFRDTSQNRRKLADAHELIRHDREGYVPGWVTHQQSALGIFWISWSKLAREYILARKAEEAGDPTALAAFMTKRLARFWADRVATPSISYGADGYTKGDYWPEIGEKAPKWELETSRNMTVDVQLDHYWCRIRAYRLAERDTDSILIWEGRVEDGGPTEPFKHVHDLQERLDVENQNVAVDVGYDPERAARARHLYRKEIKRDGRVVAYAMWVLLKGDAETKGFPVAERVGRKTETKLRIYSDPKQTKTTDGVQYSFVRFSNKLAKDKLSALIKGDGFGCPNDASLQYRKQMQSEHKIEVTPGEFRWVPVRKNIANHLWDCETMGVVMASMRGLLKQSTKQEKA